MIRRLIAKRFARALIQPRGHGLHLLIGERREIAAFREILPHQPVGVFVEATLPAMVRMGKVEVGGQRLGNRFVAGELSAVI